MIKEVKDGRKSEFRIDSKGNMRFRDRLSVHSSQEVKDEILKEVHQTQYSIHPRSTKMYIDLKKFY